MRTFAKMWALALTGRLAAELERAGVKPRY